MEIKVNMIWGNLDSDVSAMRSGVVSLTEVDGNEAYGGRRNECPVGLILGVVVVQFGLGDPRPRN